jgi:hypothetical protein
MSQAAPTGTVYEADFFRWTQQQAAALRHLSPRDNAGLDLANLIEEVEGLGRSEVDRVESALFRLLEHAALIVLAGPGHRDLPHWRGEMVAFRLNVSRAYRPSMRRLIEPALPELWRAAREAAAAKLACDAGRLPAAVPFGLADLLHALSLDQLIEALSRDFST